jgi:hypothetical protein
MTDDDPLEEALQGIYGDRREYIEQFASVISKRGEGQ